MDPGTQNNLMFLKKKKNYWCLFPKKKISSEGKLGPLFVFLLKGRQRSI